MAIHTQTFIYKIWWSSINPTSYFANSPGTTEELNLKIAKCLFVCLFVRFLPCKPIASGQHENGHAQRQQKLHFHLHHSKYHNS